MESKKKTILIVPGIFPFPPYEGGQICIYSFIDFLKEDINIHLLLTTKNKAEKEYVDKYKTILNNVNFHIVDTSNETQEPSIARKIIFSIKKIYSHIILLNKKQKTDNNIKHNFNNFKTPFFIHTEEFVLKFKYLLNQYSYDLVQLEITNMLNLVTLIPTETKKIFVDIESRHSLLKDYGTTKNINSHYVKYVSDSYKLIEHAYMRNFDAIFTLNNADAEVLRRELSDVLVYNSPFPVLDSDINMKDFCDSAEMTKIVFMGNESHLPNYDAVNWFICEILPNIKSQSFKLFITGKWTKQTIQRFCALSPNIVFTGFIDDLKSLLNGSISVVPIRLGGGGMRTKIIYALANNSAVITTSIAAVGLIDLGKDSFIVSDECEDFINELNKLIIDKTQFKKLVDNGKKLILNNFTQEILGKRRLNYYNEICNK